MASPLASADKQQYINLITEVSNNPAREIAQTEVESGFNPFAKSPYASGLRQFTKTTGEWKTKPLRRGVTAIQDRTQNELTMEEWAGLTKKVG